MLLQAAALAVIGAFFVASIVGQIRVNLSGLEAGYGHNDYIAFYTGAHFAWLGRIADLYRSPDPLIGYQRSLIPQSVGYMGYMPFLNPPYAAVLQAPLALFAEPASRLLWFAFNAALAVVLVRWLTTELPANRRLPARLLLLGTYPVYQTLIQGQWSLVLLLGGMAALHFARRGDLLASGACLAPLWLKPQLALIVIVALVACRCWRIAAGMAASLAALLLVTVPFTGFEPYDEYAPFLARVSLNHFGSASSSRGAAWQGNLSASQGLSGLVHALTGGSPHLLTDGILLFAVGLTLAVFWRAARLVRPGFGRPGNELTLVAAIALVVLLDPHVFAQDVTWLFLIIPIAARHLRNAFAALVGLCFVCDAALIDSAVPLHIFTLTLWCSATVLWLTLAAGVFHSECGNALASRLQGSPTARRLRVLAGAVFHDAVLVPADATAPQVLASPS